MSVHVFTLLDAGGIECVACARKNVVLVSMDNLLCFSDVSLPESVFRL